MPFHCISTEECILCPFMVILVCTDTFWLKYQVLKDALLTQVKVRGNIVNIA